MTRRRRTAPLRLALWAAIAAVLAAPAAPADYSSHPRAARLADLLRDEHAFTAADLEGVVAVLRDANQLPQLIEAEQKAKEKTLTWSAYRPIHLHDRNLASGARFLEQNRDWLARAEREYGVPPAVVAAILGVETKFGSFTGMHRVLDSLATQAFDHPTRQEFFLREFAEFLTLCREQGFDPRAIKGSYAGAMGAAQFMPSNYRRLAVDFDGNGRKDLWTAPDAIGSIAHYLLAYAPDVSWRRGEPLVLPARLGVEKEPLPRNGRRVTHSIGELLRAGLTTTVMLPPETPAGLIELPLDNDAREYWLGLPNFYGVMTYNPRIFYAMAVSQLAGALQAAQKGAAP